MQGVMAQANMLAFRDGFLLIGFVFVIALVPALLLSGRTVAQDMRARAAA